MATLFQDGFDHYGQGSGSGSAFYQAMSSVYAYVAGISAGIGAPAWGARTGSGAFFNVDDPQGLRYVLPTAESHFYVSQGYSIDQLPSIGNDRNTIIAFCNSANTIIAKLVIQTTGALALYEEGSPDTLLAETDGPVIQPATWYQLTHDYSASGGYNLYVNGVQVLEDVTGYADTNIAQIQMLGGPDSVFSPLATQWMDDLYINDTSGSFNNSLPGEIQVATLLVDNDGNLQGWTPNPRQLFGTGILDTTTSTNGGFTGSASSATVAMTPALQLGNGDFTLEGQFRFEQMPTGTNYFHLMGSWDVGTSLSYELALCGPSLNGGNMVFRISTDGTSGTLQNIIDWPFIPNLDTWYHIAVVRASGETMLFINGVQQGPAIADANIYFAETHGQWGIGGAGFVLDGASWFPGWVGEVRATVGYARYVANFMPPVAEFPVGSGSDAHWTDVELLANFDGGLATDLSQNDYSIALNWGAAAITPNDGAFAWEVLAKPNGPLDDTFIAAPELQATAIFTQTGNFSDGDTVTVATKDGTNAAVYRAKNVMAQTYDFKIGANLQTSLANLVAAINAGPGSGTAYFAGTLVNNDVTATQLPIQQIEVTADIAGTGGNSLACSTTAALGSWNGTHLSGGTSIPGPSNFGFNKPPVNTTLVAAVSLVSRQYKTDGGTCQTQVSITGPLGSTTNGALYNPSTNPSYHIDNFDEDPDTSAAWSPTAVVGMLAQINRTE